MAQINTKVTNPNGEQAKNQNNSSLLTIEVKRSPELGLQLMVKSSKDWSFLRDPRQQLVTISGVPCFCPKADRVGGVSSYFHKGNGYETLYADNQPNLIILLAKDIQNGVTFNLGAFPVSEDMIKKWVGLLKDQVKILYLTYCKPFNVRIEFNTQTVELEQHD